MNKRRLKYFRIFEIIVFVLMVIIIFNFIFLKNNIKDLNKGDIMEKNPVCWWEIGSINAKKSATFLKEVFGWKITINKQLDYIDFKVKNNNNGFDGGGLFEMKKRKEPFLTIYIKVKNIKKTVEKIKKNDGEIVSPVHEIANGSKVCLFKEPMGVLLAVVEKKK